MLEAKPGTAGAEAKPAATPSTAVAAAILTQENGFGLASPSEGHGPLRSRFGVPPFTDFNTRCGAWRKRKKLWMGLGITSEDGRAADLTYKIPTHLSDGSVAPQAPSSTSVFDPVLCEIAYGWWCPPGGLIGDPFAGGSVRGIVASLMGMQYYGIDLRPEQVAANYSQLTSRTVGQYPPKWRAGDSAQVAHQFPELDFVFSCPPYGDLEVYSDDPADISNMPYEQFIAAYSGIIWATVQRLKPNRFAAWVVSNYRDRKTGFIRRLTDDTCTAFAAAGCELWTYARVCTPVGSAAMRCNGTFLRGNRKLVNTTQDLLVFCKGDPAIAAQGVPMDAGALATEGAVALAAAGEE
jgi:hypothetical protein